MLGSYLTTPLTRDAGCASEGSLVLDTEDNAAMPFIAHSRRARILFRVVKHRPARQKVQSCAAAAGRKMQQHHMVVSLAGEETYGFAGEVRVNVSLDMMSRETTAVISFLGENPTFLRHNLLWHAQTKDLMYSLPASEVSTPEDAAILHHLCDSMLLAGAFPGTAAVFCASDSAPARHAEVLHMLQRASLVVGCDSGYQFTQAGLSNLKVSNKLSAGLPLLEPRLLLALADLTDFEKLTMLMDRGWTWKPLLSAAAVKKLAAIQLDDRGAVTSEKVFYTSLVPHTAYLDCLLDTGRLRIDHGIALIFHGLSAERYSNMLDGVAFDPAAAARKKRRLCIEGGVAARPPAPRPRALLAVAGPPVAAGDPPEALTYL